MSTDPLTALYNAVGKEYNLGTLEEFTTKMQDENKRLAFYNTVGQEYSLGDYETFSQKVLPVKQAEGITPHEGLSSFIQKSTAAFQQAAIFNPILMGVQPFLNSAAFRKLQQVGINIGSGLFGTAATGQGLMGDFADTMREHGMGARHLEGFETVQDQFIGQDLHDPMVIRDVKRSIDEAGLDPTKIKRTLRGEEMLEQQKRNVIKALQISAVGKELTKGDIHRLEDIEDIWDALEWASVALAEAGGQIPAAIFTGGLSIVPQEVGSIYIDQVERIAEENGISVEEVIERGLDDPAYSAAYGLAASALERAGAGAVMSSFSKKALRQSFIESGKKRALKATGRTTASGVFEGTTEMEQTVLEIAGREQITPAEVIDKILSGAEPAWASEVINAGAMGLVGGKGIAAVGEVIAEGRFREQRAAEQAMKDELTNFKQKIENVVNEAFDIPEIDVTDANEQLLEKAAKAEQNALAAEAEETTDQATNEALDAIEAEAKAVADRITKGAEEVAEEQEVAELEAELTVTQKAQDKIRKKAEKAIDQKLERATTAAEKAAVKREEKVEKGEEAAIAKEEKREAGLLEFLQREREVEPKPIEDAVPKDEERKVQEPVREAPVKEPSKEVLSKEEKKEVVEEVVEPYEGGAKKTKQTTIDEERSFEELSPYLKGKYANEQYKGHPHHEASKQYQEDKEEYAQLKKETGWQTFETEEGKRAKINLDTGEIVELTETGIFKRKAKKAEKEAAKPIPRKEKTAEEIAEEKEVDLATKIATGRTRIQNALKDKPSAAIRRLKQVAEKFADVEEIAKSAQKEIDKLETAQREKVEQREEKKEREARRKEQREKEAEEKAEAKVSKIAKEGRKAALNKRKNQLENEITKGRDILEAIKSYQAWREFNDYAPASTEAIEQIIEPAMETIAQREKKEKTKVMGRVRKQVEKADKELAEERAKEKKEKEKAARRKKEGKPERVAEAEEEKVGARTEEERKASIIQKLQQGLPLTEQEEKLVELEKLRQLPLGKRPEMGATIMKGGKIIREGKTKEQLEEEKAEEFKKVTKEPVEKPRPDREVETAAEEEAEAQRKLKEEREKLAKKDKAEEAAAEKAARELEANGATILDTPLRLDDILEDDIDYDETLFKVIGGDQVVDLEEQLRHKEAGKPVEYSVRIGGEVHLISSTELVSRISSNLRSIAKGAISEDAANAFAEMVVETNRKLKQAGKNPLRIVMADSIEATTRLGRRVSSDNVQGLYYEQTAKNQAPTIVIQTGTIREVTETAMHELMHPYLNLLLGARIKNGLFGRNTSHRRKLKAELEVDRKRAIKIMSDAISMEENNPDLALQIQAYLEGQLNKITFELPNDTYEGFWEAYADYYKENGIEQGSPAGVYALRDAGELVSESVRSNVARLLNKMVGDPKKPRSKFNTILRSIVNKVAKIFGGDFKLQEGSIFDSILTSIEMAEERVAEAKAKGRIEFGEMSATSPLLRLGKAAAEAKNRIQRLWNVIKDSPMVTSKEALAEFIDKVNENLSEENKITAADKKKLLERFRVEGISKKRKKAIQQLINMTKPSRFRTRDQGGIIRGKVVDPETIKLLDKIHKALKGPHTLESDQVAITMLNDLTLRNANPAADVVKEGVEKETDNLIEGLTEKEQNDIDILRFQLAHTRSLADMKVLISDLKEIIDTGRSKRRATQDKITKRRDHIVNSKVAVLSKNTDATEFDQNAQYKQGDKVLYKGKVYELKTDTPPLTKEEVNKKPSLTPEAWKKLDLTPKRGTRGWFDRIAAKRGWRLTLKERLRQLNHLTESFVSLLDIMDKEMKKVGADMSDWFGAMAMKAREAELAEIEGKAKYEGILIQKFNEIFILPNMSAEDQKKFKEGKVDKALAKRISQAAVDTYIRNRGETFAMPYIDSNTGERVKDEEIPELSRNQIYKKWMELQDPTLKHNFDIHGRGKDFRNKINEFMENDPALKAWAEWQLNEFYPQYYESINEVYKAHYGIDLEFNPNYSPIRYEYEAGEIKDELGVALEELDPVASLNNSSERARKRNKQALAYTDGDDVIFTHMYNNEHFKSHDAAVSDLRALFNHSSVRELLGDRFDPQLPKDIDLYVDAMARGRAYENMHQNIIDKIRNNYVKAIIHMNPTIFLKQLTSATVFAGQMPEDSPKGYMGYQAELLNPSKAAEWMNIFKNMEFIKHRADKSSRNLEEAVIEWRNMQKQDKKTSGRRGVRMFGQRQGWGKVGFSGVTIDDVTGFLVKYGDLGAFMLGGYPTYKAHYDIAKKQGKSDAEAKKSAELSFAHAGLQAQQSGSILDLSVAQLRGPGARVFTTFTTALMMYKRLGAGAVRDAMVYGLNTRKGRRAAFRAAHFYVLPHILFEFVSQGGQLAFALLDDDEEETQASLTRLAFAPISGFMRGFFLGSFAETALNAYITQQVTGERTRPLPSNVVESMSGVVGNALEAGSDIVAGDIDWKTAIALARGVDLATGRPYGNVLKWAEGIKDAAMGEDLRRGLGYSNWSIMANNEKKKDKYPSPATPPRPGSIPKPKAKPMMKPMPKPR